MPQFCMLFYDYYTILATQKGGHGTMSPPKYAPATDSSVWGHLQTTADFVRHIVRSILQLYLSLAGSKGKV